MVTAHVVLPLKKILQAVVPLGPSAYGETSECVTTQKRVAVFSRSIKYCNFSGMDFLLAHSPSCEVIPRFLWGESWSSYLLNHVEGTGVRAMRKISDDVSLRLTGATSSHRNQTGSCAEHAVRMAQPLSLMALSTMVRAGIRTAGHWGWVMWARGVLLGANLHRACTRIAALCTGVHRIFLPAGTKSEVMLVGCHSGCSAFEVNEGAPSVSSLRARTVCT